jgi:hypothetical protein
LRGKISSKPQNRMLSASLSQDFMADNTAMNGALSGDI